jgi:hypothetical protein
MGFFAICRSCLLLGGSVFYFFYAAFVFMVSLNGNRVLATSPALAGVQPPMPGELGRTFPAPRPAITTQVATVVLGLADFDSFRRLVAFALQLIRRMFFMNDNPTFMRSFLRFLNVYAIIVPLPAAFLAPVLHLQRPADYQLMIAVILLIIINALGDVISVRLVLRTFDKLHFEAPTDAATPAQDFWRNVRNEVYYYLTVLKGAGYSLAVLIVVLALSSVLFGVQIGEYDFSFSTQFLEEAWRRLWQFPHLAVEPYWFRYGPTPFGAGGGIPGLFLFGIVTFLPIILLGVLAAAWLFMVPFRIAANLPVSPVVRVLASELSIVGLCVVVDSFLQVDVWQLYGLLLTHI